MRPNGDSWSYAPSYLVVDTVMRATGILALVGIAAVHFVQLVPTFRSTPLLGVAFVALIVGSLAIGARLMSSSLSPAQLWLPTAALGIAAIAGYIFTRVLSSPLDNQDVGNWSCMLGMAALFVEGMLVVLSAYAVSVASKRHPIPIRAETPSGVPVIAGNIMQVHANGSSRHPDASSPAESTETRDSRSVRSTTVRWSDQQSSCWRGSISVFSEPAGAVSGTVSSEARWFS
jgi:hypothetical protein